MNMGNPQNAEEPIGYQDKVLPDSDSLINAAYRAICSALSPVGKIGDR